MPTGLEIDYDQDLNGTMAPYAQQVLISTGQRDWRSRIEDDGLDQGWGILGSRLKKLVFRTGKFADPYNNIVITNSSFTPSTDPSNKSVASAFLFPSFQYIPDIPLDEDGLDRFVRAFLLPLNPHKAHSILPADKLQAIRRDPELQSTFKSMTSLKHSPTILICGHGGRDQRCGIMGPLLESEFGNILKDEGYTVGITPTDKVKHANVGLISHIGGHKYAASSYPLLTRSPYTAKVADGGGTCDQLLPTMDDKSPSFCRLCNIALASPDIWRQHARSEWQNNTPSENETDESDVESPAAPEYNPEQCLFCGETNVTFDDNLFHMSKAHSFIIPYQDNLKVDMMSLLRHLYHVIYASRRCILCATRRRTVQGVHHHMMAKGHCRFDVSPDIADFYIASKANSRRLSNEASEISSLLWLPSGRARGRRTRPAKYRRTSEHKEPTPLPLSNGMNGQENTTTEDDDAASASYTQLLRLSRGDQQGLAHLSNPEVRSLLAIRAKHTDQSRREETHAKLKLEKAGNITLTAHFRADTSKRFRGPWG
ncbi:pre-60S factor rei1 [Microsporum canis]